MPVINDQRHRFDSHSRYAGNGCSLAAIWAIKGQGPVLACGHRRDHTSDFNVFHFGYAAERIFDHVLCVRDGGM